MREDDRNQKFIAFVHKAREQQGYTIEQVCGGICSLGTIHAIENGKWKPDKPIRDYILDRLGVGEEDYEYYLDRPEYNRWEEKQRILHCITVGEIGRAEELLQGYEEAYGMGDKLERQFCLGMQAQVKRLQGCYGEELSAVLEEAIALTIPGYPDNPLAQSALSTRELNLLLEVEQYRREGERAGRYLEITEYIEQKQMDAISRAKIYPKAVYFLGRCLLGKQEERTVEQAGQGWGMLLERCEKAIDVLQESARMYYLWELLLLEGHLASSLAERYALQGQDKSAEGIREWYQEKENWIWALESVYTERKIPVQMQDFCYIYVEKGCHCVNDVIRIRRKMLGMSRSALCRNICDEKTLKRLEQGKTKTQWAIVEALLERLNLPTEYARTDLITSSPDARELMRQSRSCSIHGLWDQVWELQQRIRSLVPMDIIYNRQTLKNKEIFCRWKKKEIADEEYYSQMLAVLELTLPYEVFLKEGEKYLTNEEQICIQNMMLFMDKNTEEYKIAMQRFEEMYQWYAEKRKLEAVLNVYELVMCNIGSNLGNMGEYDRSDQHSEN